MQDQVITKLSLEQIKKQKEEIDRQNNDLVNQINLLTKIGRENEALLAKLQEQCTHPGVKEQHGRDSVSFGPCPICGYGWDVFSEE